MTPGKTPYVLIVEDDRDVAAYYRQVLDLAGYRTGIATNGREAIQHLDNNPPDIVLLDLRLPGVSGVDVLEKIHAEGRRVVIVTGNAQIADSLPESDDLILYKPVTPEQLSDLVGRQVQNVRTLERHPFTRNPWDALTGLYNRDFFANRLHCALETYRENNENLFAVIVVNLEHAEPGGEVARNDIQGIAKTLKTVTRPTDTLARFNGDQFHILVENLLSGQVLSTIAQRIQRALDYHPLKGIRFSVQALLCTDSPDGMDDLLMDVGTAEPGD